MSGHSKWATIKHHKAIEDNKRGKVFSKFSRIISVAAREGGGDPEMNFKLRLVMEKAKAANMPKENIERAIERGSGKGENGQFEEVIFEGYGFGEIPVIVEALTDSRNRTTAEIKNLFEKKGGKLAKPGAVTYQFKKMGQLLVVKEEDVESQILKLIDLGAEEVEETGKFVEILMPPLKFQEMKEKLEKAGFKIESSELIFSPSNLVKLSPEKEGQVSTFLEELEDHDDVSKVTTNVDFKES